MGKGRIEAFSDGVIAIIITIMVLEIKVPHGHSISDLKPLLPVFLSYILSFAYVGIYWNNHHHMFHAVHKVNGPVMWLNLLMLFCLSLFPFATAWVGESEFAKWPTIIYGTVLLLAGVSYYFLSQCLISIHGKDSTLAKAVGKDTKGIISVVVYLIGIALAFVNPVAGFLAYAVVACIWFIPDRRIEKNFSD